MADVDSGSYGPDAKDEQVAQEARLAFSQLRPMAAIGRMIGVLEAADHYSDTTRTLRRSMMKMLLTATQDVPTDRILDHVEHQRQILGYRTRLSIIAAGDPANELHTSWAQRWTD